MAKRIVITVDKNVYRNSGWGLVVFSLPLFLGKYVICIVVSSLGNQKSWKILYIFLLLCITMIGISVRIFEYRFINY